MKREHDNDLKATQGTFNYGISSEAFETVIEELPSAQSDVLRWWFFHGKENRLSFRMLAKRTGVSSATLSRLFRGTYGADLAKICDTLGKAKDTFAEQIDDPDFIMTSLARRLFSIFDETRALQIVTILWGEKGTGKTTAAEHYKEKNNHGRTIYFRCGAAMSFGTFLAELASAMGITLKNRVHQDVRMKIKHMLKRGQRLLIVDELHELFLVCRPDVALKVCEFLRECYDVSKCGMVLIGTPVLKEHLYEGIHKDVLSQLVDRCVQPIHLPKKHTKQDVIAMHRHYGLDAPGLLEPDARQILGDLVKSNSLRKLTLHLRAGARTAAIANQKYTWAHFVAAHDRLAALSHIEEEKAA